MENSSSAIDRFWKRVNIAGDDECWIWLDRYGKEHRKTRSHRYGHIMINGRSVPAHRASYMIHNGIDPSSEWNKKDCILHKCDITMCVNPSHLSVGSQRDNVADMIRKGRLRNPRGESNGSSKLTNEIVRKIRNEMFTMKQVHIARHFGVSNVLVGKVLRNEIWRHVPLCEDPVVSSGIGRGKLYKSHAMKNCTGQVMQSALAV